MDTVSASWHDDRRRAGLLSASGCAGSREALFEDAGWADVEKFRATPAYVISGVEERWQHVRHMLSSLHITAERVVPPKPSAHMAKEMFAKYDYDKRINLSDPVQQKYF